MSIADVVAVGRRGRSAYAGALALLFEYGIATHDVDPNAIDPAKVRGIARKIGRQVLKDYVLFPLLAGPNALAVLAGNALANVVRFTFATGWRTASEVLPLEWRNVDWTGRCVRLDAHTTKNGEARSFPFTTRSYASARASRGSASKRSRHSSMGRVNG